ncbi:MAG: protein kinase [Myxococcota bacterium]
MLKLPCPYGKFELLERIGVGGMAEVYRAKLGGFAGFEKIVVVKRILPHLAAQKQFSEMFIEEAKIAARVQHRNVVQVFELGTVGEGELYIAMEYVAGTDLSVLLRNSVKRKLKIPTWFSLHVMSEILSGLAAAHDLVDEQGRRIQVVHRDVTPSNVFLSYLGDIKLGDFGVATSALHGNLTRAGELKGKIAYMAPEQLYQKALDHRADLFSAGVVLWEALTQRRLFGGRPDIETMNAIAKGPRLPPSRYNPEVPPDLDELVLAAVEADVNRRISSAVDFQSRLADILPRFAPKVLATDVRQVVEVLLGQTQPGQPTRLESPSRESTAVRERKNATGAKNFVEVSPIAVPKTYHLPPGRTSEPPPPPTAGLLAGPAQTVRPTVSLPMAAVDPQAFGVGVPEPSDDLNLVVELDADVASVAPKISPIIGKAESPPPALYADAPPWQVLGHETIPPPPDGKPFTYDGGYRGPHPFWLQNERQMIWGPCDYRSIRNFLATEGDRAAQGYQVAAYQTSWITLDFFAMLTGQEGLRGPDPLPPERRVVGNLRTRSLPAVLGSLWAMRATGRLVVVGEDPVRPPRRELHFQDGVPVYVATDAPKLQLPDLLARQGLLTAEQIPTVMHEVIYRLEPIEDVVARQQNMDLGPQMAILMQERALEVFFWRTGNYAFVQELKPARARPISSSTLDFVMHMVGWSKSDQELAAALGPYLEVRLGGTERHAQGVRELGLSQPQIEVVRHLWEGLPLRETLRRMPSEQRLLLVAAYVMVEAGLLVPLG